MGDRARSSARIPDVIFLAEAFTRPKVMHRLAKLGFTQSYTYFTWRNTKQELTEYFTELAHGAGARVLPARTLAEHARHPAPSTCRRRPRRRSWRGSCSPRRSARTTASTARPSSCWSTRRASRAARSTSTRRSTSSGTGISSAPDSLRDFIARVNRIRRENPALQRDRRPALSSRSTTTQLICLHASRPRTLGNVDARRREPRSAPRAGGLGRARLARARPRRRRAVPGARPADRRALPLAAARATTSSSIRAACRRTSSACARRVRTERDFDYFL